MRSLPCDRAKGVYDDLVARIKRGQNQIRTKAEGTKGPIVSVNNAHGSPPLRDRARGTCDVNTGGRGRWRGLFL